MRPLLSVLSLFVEEATRPLRRSDPERGHAMRRGSWATIPTQPPHRMGSSRYERRRCLNIMQCDGQFIGLRPNSCPSTWKQNMFSLYFAAWPEVSHLEEGQTQREWRLGRRVAEAPSLPALV